jgi:hypothetical protein
MGPAAHVALNACSHNRAGYAVTQYLPTLELEIESLLDPSRRARPRATVEHTLTTGYAHALALEGERLRAEGRLRTLVRSGEARREQLDAAELELERVAAELRRLRALLANLRAHAL